METESEKESFVVLSRREGMAKETRGATEAATGQRRVALLL